MCSIGLEKHIDRPAELFVGLERETVTTFEERKPGERDLNGELSGVRGRIHGVFTAIGDQDGESDAK